MVSGSLQNGGRYSGLMILAYKIIDKQKLESCDKCVEPTESRYLRVCMFATQSMVGKINRTMEKPKQFS